MPKCPLLQLLITDSIVGLMSRLLETPTYCILSWYSPATKGTKHAEYFPMIILFKIMQLSPRKYQHFLVL